MMPVPTVAGETGGVEAKHGADLAGAKPGDQLLEARTCHGAAGGSAEIVVDDIDIVKSVAAGFINEVILAALALKMDLHLRLCGLAHIHDRLAAQDGWRQGISVRHRRSPRDARRRLPSVGEPDVERQHCGRRASSRSTRDRPALWQADGMAWSKQSEAAAIARWNSSVGGSSSEHVRRSPRAFSSRSRSARPPMSIVGAPRDIVAQTAGSSIHAARTIATPGPASTTTTSLPDRRSA